jgi:response regulator RpfG family c-di-GMP phosphodiesterase
MPAEMKYKAMIIDASADSVAHLRSLLAQVGIDVVEWARNGIGWVEAWSGAKTDLVVVDYVLPGKDGLFVVEKIAQADPGCGLIFLHSFEGWVANQIEVKAYAKGASACFQRPCADIRFQYMAERIAAQSAKKRAPTKVKMSGSK